jgi:hypothetical protein
LFFLLSSSFSFFLKIYGGAKSNSNSLVKTFSIGKKGKWRQKMFPTESVSSNARYPPRNPVPPLVIFVEPNRSVNPSAKCGPNE